jgi:hypothetical protein
MPEIIQGKWLSTEIKAGAKEQRKSRIVQPFAEKSITSTMNITARIQLHEHPQVP